MRRLTDGSSPFYNKVDERKLGPLEPSEVKDLIDIPLTNLRIQLRNRMKVLQDIEAETQCYPWFAQYFGVHLFEKAQERTGQQAQINRNAPNGFIQPSDVHEISESYDFSELLMEHFIECTTEKRQVARLERYLAALLAHHDDYFLDRRRVHAIDIRNEI